MGKRGKEMQVLSISLQKKLVRDIKKVQAHWEATDGIASLAATVRRLLLRGLAAVGAEVGEYPTPKMGRPKKDGGV